MSSTNRGADRKGFDDYPTPTPAIDSFLVGSVLPGGRWLEPCAGEGRIIERVNAAHTGGADILWHAWEIQPRYRNALECLEPPPVDVQIGDCIALAHAYAASNAPLFDVAITNPPYNQAMPILLALRRIAHTVVLLLRRNFIGSAKRAVYLRDNMPDEYLLPRRPSFVWRHTYWLRCTGCPLRIKVIEDVQAGQPASKSSAYVRMIAGVEYEHDPAKCMGHGVMHLADQVSSYNPKTDKTKTTTSDSCEYCWCKWTPDSGPVGSTRMLALPSEQR